MYGRAAGETHRPSDQQIPAGAMDAGLFWFLVFIVGTGRSPSPMGTATNRVACPDFTRINTVRLPPACASDTALRTSAGEETSLPLTSRMTSPFLTRSPALPF